MVNKNQKGGTSPKQTKGNDRDRPHSSIKPPKVKRAQYASGRDNKNITEIVEGLKLLSKHF